MDREERHRCAACAAATSDPHLIDAALGVMVLRGFDG